MISLTNLQIFICFFEQGAYSAGFKHAGKSTTQWRSSAQAGKQAKVCSQRTRTAAVQPYNSDLHVDNEALQKKGRVACCSPHAWATAVGRCQRVVGKQGALAASTTQTY